MRPLAARACPRSAPVLKRACVKRLVDLRAAANNEAVAKLEQQLKDAEENAGETEIRDAFLARAEHYATIGDKVRGTTRARVTVRGALTPERAPPLAAPATADRRRRWSGTTRRSPSRSAPA